MEISIRTAWICTVAASCCAFLGGRATSIYFIQHADLYHEEAFAYASTEKNQNISTKSPQETHIKEALPTPVLPHGKKFPKAKYTGMHFSETVSKYENLHLKDMVGQGLDEECFVNDDGRRQCIIDRTANASNTELDGDTYPAEGDGEEHLPAGQHLLIDIKNVDAAFLDSEHRLANAMVDVVTESKLTLLSYHCHKLMPMGVTCVGILLESHISFHTWPEAGVITLDLFTCGSGKLVPVVPIIERLFAVPQDKSVADAEKPMMKWWHTFRGFREEEKIKECAYLGNDLGEQILEQSHFIHKKEIAWAKTPFQRIDIYDTIPLSMDYDSYRRSLKDDGSYESLHPDLYRPQRTVFLDGVLQSTLKGLEAYHEALVQPVMFSHPDPKRVAIIGGGEGATLREVLKHNTVDVVKMIEIDEEMVKVSRDHLPEWNGCGDFIGSDVAWCGDDERAEIHYEDAISWFKDRFSEDHIDSEEYDEEPFDVLIMDALDPQDNIPFAQILYTDETFIESLYGALSDNGVMVFQLGVAPYSADPADELTFNERRSALISLLEEVGFEGLRVYEDGHCGFEDPWVFLIAMKSADSLTYWFQSEANVQINIHDRMLRTRSGEPALWYFDGGVMSNYRYPHKAFESIFCKSTPRPEVCAMEDVFQERAPDVPLSALDVRKSSIGDGSGRGVFTKVDIKKGSTIGRATRRHPVLMNPFATELMFHYMYESRSFDDLYRYMDGYGWENNMIGDNTYLVDSSILTFVNHGCNGTYNMESFYGRRLLGTDDYITEQNATEDFSLHHDIFDPFSDRHNAGNLVIERALSDFKSGSELLCNYLFLAEDQWWDAVTELKNICNGKDLGLIFKSEMKVLMEKDEFATGR